MSRIQKMVFWSKTVFFGILALSLLAGVIFVVNWITKDDDLLIPMFIGYCIIAIAIPIVLIIPKKRCNEKTRQNPYSHIKNVIYLTSQFLLPITIIIWATMFLSYFNGFGIQIIWTNAFFLLACLWGELLAYIFTLKVAQVLVDSKSQKEEFMHKIGKHNNSN
jgi:hypothetical protein